MGINLNKLINFSWFDFEFQKAHRIIKIRHKSLAPLPIENNVEDVENIHSVYLEDFKVP